MKKYFLALIALLLILTLTSCEKSVTRNYGVANMKIDVLNSEEFRAEDVVPAKDALIENLEKAGYEIKTTDSVPDGSIPANRIRAEKDNKFIDICYGLTEKEAENVFTWYENTYKEFYLMARNEAFVYCISDKQTFRKAGFSSLANVGVQIICE